MDPALLGRGFVFGLSLAASVGPMWLLCARRTLAEGRAVGLASGLGVATADAFYGAVAASGLSILAAALVGQRMLLGVVGGAFLVYLGMRTLLAKPRASRDPENSHGLWWAFLSTFSLTLTNPLTIVAFVGIFAGLGLADAVGNASAAAVLVMGVFIGSAAWWLVLTAVLGRARHLLSERTIRLVNLAAGGLIAALGALAVASALAR